MLAVTDVNIILVMLLKSEQHFLIEIILNLFWEQNFNPKKAKFSIYYMHSTVHKSHVHATMQKLFTTSLLTLFLRRLKKFSCEQCSYDDSLQFPTTINQTHEEIRVYFNNPLCKDSADSVSTCWTVGTHWGIRTAWGIGEVTLILAYHFLS